MTVRSYWDDLHLLSIKRLCRIQTIVATGAACSAVAVDVYSCSCTYLNKPAIGPAGAACLRTFLWYPLICMRTGLDLQTGPRCCKNTNLRIGLDQGINGKWQSSLSTVVAQGRIQDFGKGGLNIEVDL